MAAPAARVAADSGPVTLLIEVVINMTHIRTLVTVSVVLNSAKGEREIYTMMASGLLIS